MDPATHWLPRPWSKSGSFKFSHKCHNSKIMVLPNSLSQNKELYFFSQKFHLLVFVCLKNYVLVGELILIIVIFWNIQNWQTNINNINNTYIYKIINYIILIICNNYIYSVLCTSTSLLIVILVFLVILLLLVLLALI